MGSRTSYAADYGTFCIPHTPQAFPKDKAPSNPQSAVPPGQPDRSKCGMTPDNTDANDWDRACKKPSASSAAPQVCTRYKSSSYGIKLYSSHG